MANLGMARTIFPVHTAFDGDLCIALSLGNESAELNTLGVAAAEAVAKSIVLAVKSSATLGGLPGLAGPKR
jgi:L-aminopeptidase/D-esterase-like protein